jgi:hypothetical protein
LDVFPPGAGPLSPQAEARWIWAFLIIGLTLRLTRYILRFPLWEDEACLAANFLDRGYLDLLKPCDYCVVAPPLFLWLQLAMVKLLGYTEYTLRLVPFLCGMASLVLFRHVAGRLLRGTALVLAVGIFAVSYPMTRYAAEAKPYAADLLVALVMLALLFEWLRRPGENRWLWGLAAMIGPAIGYSFAAAFMGGAVSLVLGYVLWSSGRRGWLPWAVYNLVLVGSFACLLAVTNSGVADSTRAYMEDLHWAGAFPPLAHPLELAGWLASIHTGGMLGYPVGGPHGGSALSLVFCLAGVAVLARRRQGLLLGILLAPLGLNFIAAAMHRYPYGGHVRLQLFLAPAFSILIGLGIAAVLAWHARRRSTEEGSRRPLVAALAVLAALGGASLLRDLCQPYKSGTTLRAREFARWFWFDLAHQGELVCFETDLKESLTPGKRQCAWSSLYYCNQRIYSPQHARGELPQWDRISADWPLRCVLYRSPAEERDSPAADPHVREHWLERMESQYRLVAHDSYPMPAYDKSDRRPISDDFIEVFKFVPRGETASRSPAGRY